MRRTLPLLLICLCLLASAGGCFTPVETANPTGGAEDVDLGPVGPFRMTERSGREVGRDELLGKVWVASFVFTCCTGPCPQVSGSMAQLHKELGGEKDVRLVTFTVDPDRDTPAVLKEYAGRYGADEQRWLFLTGEREALYKLVREGFHLGVQQNEGPERTPGNEVTHSTRLVVVDRRGHVRGYFDGRRVDEQGQPVNDLPKVIKRVLDLLREQP